MGNLQTDRPQTVAVLGLGYIGCVTAACLARLGHRVIGIGKDAHKVDSVTKGHAPFFEPGLEDWVREIVPNVTFPPTAGPVRKPNRNAVAVAS